jgi:hypothetical protein
MADAADLTPKMSPDKFPLISLTLQFRILAELKVMIAQNSSLIALKMLTGETNQTYSQLVESNQKFFEGMSKEIYQNLLTEAYVQFGE